MRVELQRRRMTLLAAHVRDSRMINNYNILLHTAHSNRTGCVIGYYDETVVKPRSRGRRRLLHNNVKLQYYARVYGMQYTGRYPF